MNATTIQTDTIRALCARIQAAAIKCEAYHVFVDYAAHVSALSVRVHPADTVYDGVAEQENLIYETVYLDADWCDPIAELTAIIDQLQRLAVEV